MWILKTWLKYVMWYECLCTEGDGGGWVHFICRNALSVTGTTYQWFIGLFMKFTVFFFFPCVTCLTFLTLIKQFEKVIIKTRQNNMRHLKNILQQAVWHILRYDFFQLGLLNGFEHIKRFSNQHYFTFKDFNNLKRWLCV